MYAGSPADNHAPGRHIVDEDLKPTVLQYSSLGSVSKSNTFSHDDDQELIKLSDLMREKEDVDETCTLGMVTLWQVLYYHRQGKTPEKVYNRKSGEMSDAAYERIIFFRCILSSSETNVVAIMMNKRRNAKLFDHHLTLRDHKGFIPGTIVTLERPQIIENKMGNIPVFDTPSSLKIVDSSNLELLEVPISDDCMTMSAWHYPNAKLKLLEWNLIDVPCKGTLCDGLGLYQDGVIPKHCCCISNSSNSSKIIMVVKVKIIPPVHNTFVVNNFTSHHFTQMFIKKGANGIPPNLSSSILSADDKTMRKFERTVMKLVESQSFAITGWSRRGTIQDQGSFSDEKIKNSILNHHVVHVDCNKTIEEDKKFDLSTFFRTLKKKRKSTVLSQDDDEKNKGVGGEKDEKDEKDEENGAGKDEEILNV